MYTEYLPKILHHSFLIAGSIGATSLHFNEKTKMFYITKKSRKMSKFTLIFLMGSTLFAILRTLEILFCKGGFSNEDFDICYAISFAMVLVNSVALVDHWKQDDLCHMFNQLLAYGLKFRRKWMTKSYNPNTMNCLQGKMLDTWILVFWIMSAFPLFLGVPFYFANTNLPIFPPSMLPSANVVSVVSLIKFEFQVPSGNQGKKSNTYNLLRTVKYLPHEYACVQLLHQRVNDSFGNLMGILHGEFLNFIISCYVILALNWNLMDIYAKMQLLVPSITSQLCWSIGLKIAGSFYKSLNAMLKSWRNLHHKSPEEMKYFKKYAKTCQPLTFGAPGVFTIKRLTVLTFSMNVFKGTFKAVLALRRAK
ncbi:hypothetical protein Fcan01_10482 [Folsomia candida]|uniref:Uncharacterized protein n=1 Tax=Folsomia candida TaxID=158441 RepID=A0A226EA04_FOLCA|nr:hypothetical protein Fcan01_10482 [Folsomia candida]